MPLAERPTVRVVDFPFWWNRGEFFEKYGGRGIDTGNPLYADFALLLTRREAVEWDKRCREAYGRDPRNDERPGDEAMRRWETIVEEAAWVVVESYAWESDLA